MVNSSSSGEGPHRQRSIGLRVVKTLLRIAIVASAAMVFYVSSPRVKFYVHHGIWLPGYCTNFHFRDYPDLFSVFGLDGAHTYSTFEVPRDDVQDLIHSIGPQSIWARYGELDPEMTDSTFQCPCILSPNALYQQPNIMLYSNDTKGEDYYNIWLLPDSSDTVKVTIAMPFT
jgi:hypothetical protein